MAGGIDIVVCCSDEDRSALTDAMKALSDEGHTIQLVDGVVEDPKRLSAVISALSGEGLYVLCRSQGLGRSSLEALREVLLSAQVPFSRTLTVAATRPSLVVDRVRGSISRVRNDSRVAAAPSAPARKPATSPITSPATSPAPRAVAPAAAKKSPPSPPAKKPPPVRAAPKPPPPPPAAREDSVVAELPSESSVSMKVPGDAPADVTPPDLDLSDFDSGHTAIKNYDLAALHAATTDTSTGGGGGMDAASVRVDPVSSTSITHAPAPPTSPPAPAPTSRPAPPPAAPPAAPPAQHAASHPVVPPSRLPWIIGGVALAVLVVGAAIWSMGDEDSGDGTPIASKSEVKSDPADKTAADNKAKADDAPNNAETTQSGTPDAADPDAPPTAVLAAIQRRNVRALDVLLVQANSAGVLAWDDARDYCRTLTLDALDQWRLPELGELRSISAANMLRTKLKYWSATAADTFGDQHLAWQPRRGRILDSVTKAEVLCVRGDRVQS